MLCRPSICLRSMCTSSATERITIARWPTSHSRSERNGFSMNS